MGSRSSKPAREPRRREVAVVRGAVGLLVVLVVAGALLLGGSSLHGPVATPEAAPARPAASPSSLPSEAVTGGTGSGSPTPSATSTDVPGFIGMKNFVVQYLDTVTSSTANGWEQLTPRFRSRSGGYAAYAGFWGDITHAEPRDFTPGGSRTSISYDVTYTHADGSTSTDSTTLLLAFAGGRFRVAGEG